MLRNWLFLSVAALAPAVLAQEVPQMPMQARYEDGANYRWINKPVAESRLLDSMESLANWKISSFGEISLTDVRARDGRHSLRVRGVTGPKGPDWHDFFFTRTFPGEDWSRFNRISVWVYPDMAGATAISFSLTLHNDGAHKLPGRAQEGRNESIILQNRTWNHVVWEIGTLDRDKVTALDLGYSQGKELPDPGDRAILDIDQLQIERVAADHVEGWNVAPGQIAFSHSGYTAGSTKSAIASDLSAREFSIIRQATGEVVLSKPVVRTKAALGEYQVLDFSEVREPGTYVIKAADLLTRSFRIGDDAWLSSLWKAINFLYSERCGVDVPGVHGKCHQDCYSKHGDKRISVNGGWHDAGDLTATGHIPGISYSLFALAERLERQGNQPALTKRVIEEAKWGLDWVLKTRFGDGFRTTGQLISVWTNGIMGDSDDRSGEATNDPEFHFRDCATEAIAYRVLKNSDPELAARSLIIAHEDWDYGVKGIAVAKPYTPVYGATDELERTSIALLATIDLYQATGEKQYADQAFKFARQVMASQQRSFFDWKLPLTGFFYTSPAREHLFQRFHIGEEQAPLVAMSRMCEVFPDHPEWMKWYSAAVLHSEYYLKAASKVNAPFDVLPAAVYRESEASLIPLPTQDKSGYSMPLSAADRGEYVEQVRQGVPLGGEYYLRRMPVWFDFRGNHSVLLSQTKALAAAAQLRGDLGAADLAQKQLQWVVGRNPFASSTMYGEGYDWPPYYTVRSGHMVGALPVGIETRGIADAPYWPTQICWTYKEVWVHPVGRWVWLMQDLAGPALVEGLVKQAAHEPLEFREQSTGQVTVVPADFVHGTFRALLAEGRYTVTQGERHTSLTLLPGGVYHVDLRPGQAFDFQAKADTESNGTVTLRVSAEGVGRHKFAVRTENLTLTAEERSVELEPAKPGTVTWKATITARDTPWVAVVVPDGALDQRKELTGTLVAAPR